MDAVFRKAEIDLVAHLVEEGIAVELLPKELAGCSQVPHLRWKTVAVEELVFVRDDAVDDDAVVLFDFIIL